MNFFTQTHPVENLLCGIADCARSHHKAGSTDDYFDMRNKHAVSGAAIPHTDHAVASILRDCGVDEEARHAITINDVHRNTPLCNDDDHRMPQGTVTNIIDAPSQNRRCVASCAENEHSTITACEQLEVAS